MREQNVQGEFFMFVASTQSFLYRVFVADRNNASEWNIQLRCNDAQLVGASNQRFCFNAYEHYSLDAILINSFHYVEDCVVMKTFLMKISSILRNMRTIMKCFERSWETLSYIVKVGHTWKHESTRKIVQEFSPKREFVFGLHNSCAHQSPPTLRHCITFCWFNSRLCYEVRIIIIRKRFFFVTSFPLLCACVSWKARFSIGRQWCCCFHLLVFVVVQWTDMKNRASPSRSCVTSSSIDFNSFSRCFCRKGSKWKYFSSSIRVTWRQLNEGGNLYSCKQHQNILTHRRRRSEEKTDFQSNNDACSRFYFLENDGFECFWWNWVLKPCAFNAQEKSKPFSQLKSASGSIVFHINI